MIIGKLHFFSVRIKIQHMELQLIEKETTGVAPGTITAVDTIVNYEIMGGALVKGESMPVRLLSGI